MDLTREEENKIVRENKGLVNFFTRRYARDLITRIGWDDTLQHGYIGFLSAIRTWEPERGSLSTWAAIRMRREFYYTRRYYEATKRNPGDREPVSLDAPIDAQGTPLLNMLSDSSMPFVEIIEARDMVVRIFLLGCLSDRDRLILYLLMRRWSKVEIGLVIGVTKQAVDQAFQVIRDKVRVRVRW